MRQRIERSGCCGARWCVALVLACACAGVADGRFVRAAEDGRKPERTPKIVVFSEAPTPLPEHALSAKDPPLFEGVISLEKDGKVETTKDLSTAKALVAQGYRDPRYIGLVEAGADDVAKSWAYYASLPKKDQLNAVRRPTTMPADPKWIAAAAKRVEQAVTGAAGKGPAVFVEAAKPTPLGDVSAWGDFVGTMGCGNHLNPQHLAQSRAKREELEQKNGCKDWDYVGVRASQNPAAYVELLKRATELNATDMTNEEK